MRRREFIALVGGIATWPLAVNAQKTANIARIGFLGPASASSWADRLEAFRGGLRDLGYVEGQNIVIEVRWADEKYGRLPELAAVGRSQGRRPRDVWDAGYSCSQARDHNDSDRHGV